MTGLMCIITFATSIPTFVYFYAEALGDPAFMVANVLVSKYADHLPLYRQAHIFRRQGVDLNRSTLANWVGSAAFEFRPVHDALMADLTRSTKLFVDETRAPVLDPVAKRPRLDTSEPWPAMIDLGVAPHGRAWPSPFPLAAAASMQTASCRVLATIFRLMATLDTIA